MSASPSVPSEEVRKLLQDILKSPSLDYPEKRCSGPTTPGRFCEPCLRLGAVDAKLYTLLEEVNKLLLIRKEVKERLNQLHDPFTRQLPLEIASYIFAIYTEDFNSDFDPRFPVIQNGGPLLLAAVSKSWRRVALATPHLWNTVNIILSNHNLPRKVELTKQWLDRSRRLPLHLSLVFGTSPYQVESEPSLLIPLFNVLQNFAPRWWKLVLGIPGTFFATFLGEVTSAPMLDTLKLINDQSAGEFRLPHTPSLKHLDIFRNFLPGISIQWNNLTTFESDGVFGDEFFEVLRLAEGLHSFRLRGLTRDTVDTSDAEEHSLPTTSITHPALRELYLVTGDDSDIDPSELETLLNLAIFPSLERFGYKSTRASFFPNSALPSMFNRSHCQLTHFELSGRLENGTADDLISILSDLPTITHLKLDDSHSWRSENAIMSDKLLQRLTPIPRSEFTNTGRLLPRLESLEFIGYKAFSWSCLASLVNTTTTSDGGPYFPTTSERQESTTSIRHISFRLYFWQEVDFIDEHSIARLKDARDAGISIVILNEVPFFDGVGNPIGAGNPVNLFP